MNTYVREGDFIQRPVFVVNGDSFHSIQCRVGAINDLSEDGILAVQMRLLVVCYEELGFVCIWTRVGHGHHPPGVKLGEARNE